MKRENFSLERWFELGKPNVVKVIDGEDVPATIMMEPMGLMENGTPYGPMKIAIPGGHFSVLGSGVIANYFMIIE